MCVLCGELIMQVHWTDQKLHDKEYSSKVVEGELRHERKRSRLKRALFTSKVLAYYGLSLTDWQGSKYLLADKKGQQKIVQDLGDLWPEAQKMCGRALDVLDPKLLSYLQVAGEGINAAEK